MGDEDVEVKPYNGDLDRALKKFGETVSPPTEYRLSVRLTPQEYARIVAWQEYFQARTKGHYTATQKTVLLEALDALDYREAERERKSRRSSSRKKSSDSEA